MNTPLTFLMLISGAFLFMKCTDESLFDKENIIGLETHTENEFSGSLSITEGVLSYSVNAISDLTFDLIVETDQFQLTAQLDYENEKISLNGAGVILSSEDKRGLRIANRIIAEYFLEENVEIDLGPYSLVSMLAYWGKSPEGYQYNTREYISPIALNMKGRDEGITCIQVDTYVNAEYDDASGSHSDRILVGSEAREDYDCMGRCGADCGTWWIPSSWTKDCLDHDQCSNVNNADGGSSDPNCGDEYDDAVDDYVFGVIWGCNGR